MFMKSIIKYWGKENSPLLSRGSEIGIGRNETVPDNQVAAVPRNSDSVPGKPPIPCQFRKFKTFLKAQNIKRYVFLIDNMLPTLVGPRMHASLPDTELTCLNARVPSFEDPPKNCASPGTARPQNFPIF